MNYRFSLGKKVGQCPRCGRRTLKLYEDTATGLVIHPAVGRCNREVKCRYHCTPRQYFAAGGHVPAAPPGWTPPPPPRPDQYITIYERRSTIHDLCRNKLFCHMAGMFGRDTARHVWDIYQVMNSGWHGGAAAFSYVDHAGSCRSIKLMRYGADGHRCKDGPYGYNVCWAHSMLPAGSFRFRSCLFGSHLLARFPAATVAIVESEKTALMAACRWYTQLDGGHMLFLASGGAGSLAVRDGDFDDPYSRVYPLAGRDVVLIPDADMAGSWRRYADALAPHTATVKVVDVAAPPLGLTDSQDLADYIETEYNKTNKKTDKER